MMRVKDSNAFRARMDERQFSLSTLGARAYRKKTWMHKVATGESRLDEVDAKLLARALRCRVSDLFEPAPQPSREAVLRDALAI